MNTKHSKSPSLQSYGVTRGRLPQRAGSPCLNDRRQIKDRQYKTKHNPEKANNAKLGKTKLAWFSRLIRHSARKQGWHILQLSRAHTDRELSLNSDSLLTRRDSAHQSRDLVDHSYPRYVQTSCY